MKNKNKNVLITMGIIVLLAIYAIGLDFVVKREMIENVTPLFKEVDTVATITNNINWLTIYDNKDKENELKADNLSLYSFNEAFKRAYEMYGTGNTFVWRNKFYLLQKKYKIGKE